MIEFTYDKEVDGIYLSLKKIGKGEVKHTQTVYNKERMVNLDFDKHDKLIGVEVF